jgi:hypothetical protein
MEQDREQHMQPQTKESGSLFGSAHGGECRV